MATTPASHSVPSTRSFTLSVVSIPKRNGAGNGEAKGHRRSVIVNDANQEKGDEEADTDPQEVGQRIVDEHRDAEQGVGRGHQEGGNRPQAGNER